MNAATAAVMNAAAAASANRVSNLTNSTDPHAINSRVFVGNLNTFIVTKDDVERLFKRYGRIVAISMHKGYAFVQFSNTIEARNSVVGEDGRMIANQILDVNMVSEPKPHQTGRKRHCLLAAAAPPTDWDLFYEGYPIPRIVPPIKRSRIDFLTTVRLQRPKIKGIKNAKHQSIVNANPIQTQSCQDTLICGSCRESFSDIQKMIEHKKIPCRLRACCKCQEDVNVNNDTSSEKSSDNLPYYSCYVCKEKFASSLEIIEHAHNSHDIKIVDIPEEEDKLETDDQILKDIHMNGVATLGGGGGGGDIDDEDILSQSGCSSSEEVKSTNNGLDAQVFCSENPSEVIETFDEGTKKTSEI
ncbi:HNRNPC (predicted) [Pycnogonum litorale]